MAALYAREEGEGKSIWVAVVARQDECRYETKRLRWMAAPLILEQ